MIENATYTKDGSIIASIDGLEMTVPDDMDNRHRIMLSEWEAAGNVIESYTEPTLTIEQKRALMPVKTPREFRDILIDEGVLTDAVPDEVTIAIQQIPFDKERAKALNAWQNPTMFTRTDPYIDMIGAMFGLTPEDIDLLWQDNNES